MKKFTTTSGSINLSGASVQAELGHVLAMLERLATTRQRWVGHEIAMQIERLVLGSYAMIATIGIQFPALFIIEQIGNHDLFEHLIVGVFDTPSKTLLFSTEERVDLLGLGLG